MDVLRENIGLLQLPYEDEYYYDEEDINEGFLGFGKKKSRWQRFKDYFKGNSKRLRSQLLGGALGSAAAYAHGKLTNAHPDDRRINMIRAFGAGAMAGEIAHNKLNGQKWSSLDDRKWASGHRSSDDSRGIPWFRPLD